MASDLVIPRITAAANVPDQALPRATQGGDAPDRVAPEAGPPNPTIHIDGELGLVVIEFRDTSGAIASTIPSERQLEAYRQWQQTHSAAPDSAGDPAVLHGSGTGHA